MASEEYEGRKVQVISFDDSRSGDYVVEFIDPIVSSTDSVVAIFNHDSDWSDARVSISPRVDSVSAEFLIWALDIARRMMQGDAN